MTRNELFSELACEWATYLRSMDDDELHIWCRQYAIEKFSHFSDDELADELASWQLDESE